MIKAQRGELSPCQLFFIFFVSRIVVSFTYIQSVSVGSFCSDVPISFAVSFFVTALLSVPAVLCVKKDISPCKKRMASAFYLLYFLYFSSLTVSRFAYFATTKMNPSAPMLMFIVLTFLAGCYGAYLGIEALGRFASFCGALLLLVIFVVLAFNVHNFNGVNLYPLIENSKRNIFMNTVIFSCNTIEPVMLLSLSDKTNGNSIKPYFAGVGCAYFGMLLLLTFCCGVLGKSANLQSFPIYTLFQMASIDGVARLDILHTAFWIFAVFFKTAVLLLCASTLVKKYNYSVKLVVSTLVSFAGSLFMNEVIGMKTAFVSKYITIVMFAIFAVVVPICTLALDRRK